jgi:hypothetical protein
MKIILLGLYWTVFEALKPILDTQIEYLHVIDALLCRSGTIKEIKIGSCHDHIN